MNKHHDIKKIVFEGKNMILDVDGKKYSFTLSDISSKLADASDVEREKYDISPSGYGIHWPLLDEDISIDGLLGIKHSPDQIREKVSA